MCVIMCEEDKKMCSLLFFNWLVCKLIGCVEAYILELGVIWLYMINDNIEVEEKISSLILSLF